MAKSVDFPVGIVTALAHAPSLVFTPSDPVIPSDPILPASPVFAVAVAQPLLDSIFPHPVTASTASDWIGV